MVVFVKLADSREFCISLDAKSKTFQLKHILDFDCFPPKNNRHSKMRQFNKPMRFSLIISPSLGMSSQRKSLSAASFMREWSVSLGAPMLASFSSSNSLRSKELARPFAASTRGSSRTLDVTLLLDAATVTCSVTNLRSPRDGNIDVLLTRTPRPLEHPNGVKLRASD